MSRRSLVRPRLTRFTEAVRPVSVDAMPDRIDSERLIAIADEYRELDPLEAYYRKRSIASRTESGFPCLARDIVTATIRGAAAVLDVGCGDGEALVESAGEFERGVGVDGSEFALAAARERARKEGAQNLTFEHAKAVSLPFDDEEFDVVFAERAPLGHADVTLPEALRVLRPRGRILIETMGSHLQREYPMSDGWTHQGTLLTSVEIERDRFQRHGVEPELLLSNVHRNTYDTVYAWFESLCSVRAYLGQELPAARTIGDTLRLVREIVAEDGSISLTHHQIVIGGIKKG